MHACGHPMFKLLLLRPERDDRTAALPGAALRDFNAFDVASPGSENGCARRVVTVRLGEARIAIHGRWSGMLELSTRQDKARYAS